MINNNQWEKKISEAVKEKASKWIKNEMKDRMKN